MNASLTRIVPACKLPAKAFIFTCIFTLRHPFVEKENRTSNRIKLSDYWITNFIPSHLPCLYRRSLFISCYHAHPHSTAIFIPCSTYINFDGASFEWFPILLFPAPWSYWRLMRLLLLVSLEFQPFFPSSMDLFRFWYSHFIETPCIPNFSYSPQNVGCNFLSVK